MECSRRAREGGARRGPSDPSSRDLTVRTAILSSAMPPDYCDILSSDEDEIIASTELLCREGSGALLAVGPEVVVEESRDGRRLGQAEAEAQPPYARRGRWTRRLEPGRLCRRLPIWALPRSLPERCLDRESNRGGSPRRPGFGVDPIACARLPSRSWIRSLQGGSESIRSLRISHLVN